RNPRDRPPVARLALRGPGRREAAQIALQFLHPPQDPAAVDFELRLTGAAGADARALLAQLQAAAAQARQPVAQLREFHLHAPFLGRRVLGEDVEDQRDAVDDVARE